ncbi:Signal peptidase complex subunit 2 [Chytridiales sp. JEL 0842]|nr:Signal peptidase complex subunit 2 [Chytridiales sp. JEL 0842]
MAEKTEVLPPITIDTYNGAEVKHTLDDAVCRILADELGYKENHRHTDIKLVLGYTACLIAGGATAYSYFIPFPDCKDVLLGSVIAYFVLNGIMLLYALYVEQDVVFVGNKKDPLKLV